MNHRPSLAKHERIPLCSKKDRVTRHDDYAIVCFRSRRLGPFAPCEPDRHSAFDGRRLAALAATAR